MDRCRSEGVIEVPRSLLVRMFGSEAAIAHPRVRARLETWRRSGNVIVVGRDDCYLRITGPLA